MSKMQSNDCGENSRYWAAVTPTLLLGSAEQVTHTKVNSLSYTVLKRVTEIFKILRKNQVACANQAAEVEQRKSEYGSSQLFLTNMSVIFNYLITYNDSIYFK